MFFRKGKRNKWIALGLIPAHGDGQMAFAAWANQGAEYMDIIVNPDGTKSTAYTWAYPWFELNVNYYQLYDEQGSGFFKQMDEIYHYDVDMTYAFLFGDGSDGTAPADYTGMARVYREFLLEKGELTLAQAEEGDIPIRLDFIMADSKSSIVGNTQVEMTTAEDVEEILGQVLAKGITNVNSGLIGWQKGGDTFSANYYSMEYTLYEELIETVYGQVNGVLGQVQGYEWTDRAVPEDGVVINSCRRGGEARYVVVSFVMAYLLNKIEVGKGLMRTIYFLPVIIMSGPVMSQILDKADETVQAAQGGAFMLNKAYKMSATLISISPLLLLYVFVQKQFIQGIENTGITGE